MESCPLPSADTWQMIGGYAVALSMGLASMLVCLVVNYPAALLDQITGSVAALDWIKEASLHASFYSSALATLVGIPKCHNQWLSVSAIVLVAATLLAVSMLAAGRAHRLDRRL